MSRENNVAQVYPGLPELRSLVRRGRLSVFERRQLWQRSKTGLPDFTLARAAAWMLDCFGPICTSVNIKAAILQLIICFVLKNPNMVLILGVTGTGKGRLAFELAKSVGAEIISIDSMKVYRRMDIGTAKPTGQARRQVRYHLIDIVEPSDSFSVGLFLDSALSAVEQINNRNKPVIAVGGTALYIKALLYGLFQVPQNNEQIRNELRERAQTEGLEQLYQELEKVDTVAAQNIHPNDAKRIIRALEVFRITGRTISSLQQQWERCDTTHSWSIIGLRRQKSDIDNRISRRAENMLAAGLVEEVKSLLSEDKPLSKQARCAIGYAEIIEHLNGQISLEEAVEKIKNNTRRLAKSQRTWFKTFRDVNWLDVEPEEPVEKTLIRTKGLLKKQ